MAQFRLFWECFLKKIFAKILLAGTPGLDDGGSRMLLADRYQAYFARVTAAGLGRPGDSFVDTQ